MAFPSQRVSHFAQNVFRLLISDGCPPLQDDIDVPTRMYGYSRAAVDCTPNTTFTGSSEMFSVSGGEAGDDFTICVRFQKDDCMTMGSADFTGELLI